MFDQLDLVTYEEVIKKFRTLVKGTVDTPPTQETRRNNWFCLIKEAVNIIKGTVSVIFWDLKVTHAVSLHQNGVIIKDQKSNDQNS